MSSQSLLKRPRRLRRTETLRRMVRETILTVDDLIYPVFVMEGEGEYLRHLILSSTIGSPPEKWARPQ